MKLRFTTSHTDIKKNFFLIENISKNYKLCKIQFSSVVFIKIRKFVSKKCMRKIRKTKKRTAWQKGVRKA